MGMTEQKIAEMMDDDGNLTDEQMATVLDSGFDLESLGTLGDKGDTDGDQPTPDEVKQTPEQEASPSDKPPEGEPDTVSKGDEEEGGEGTPTLMAKDGVHTIPYEKLTDARDEARDSKEQAEHWKEIAETQSEQLDEFKTLSEKQPEPDPDQAAKDEDVRIKSEDMEFLKEDYPEAAKRIEAVMDQNADLSEKVDSLTKRLDDGETLTEAEKHFGAIEEKYPDFEEIQGSDKFKTWMADELDALDYGNYHRARDSGSAEEAIVLLDKFRIAHPLETAPKADDSSPAAPKDTAIIDGKVQAAKDKASAPVSLSDVPGESGQHDEVEAIREASAVSLMDRFEGQSQEDIENLLQRVL